MGFLKMDVKVRVFFMIVVGFVEFDVCLIGLSVNMV